MDEKENVVANEPAAEPTKTTETKETPTDKQVSKSLLDKALSEKAELARKLKAIDDREKSAEQLAQEKVQEAELKYQEIQLKLGRSTLVTAISEAKTLYGEKDIDGELNTIIDSLADLDENVSATRGTALNAILLAVYKKGAADAVKSDAANVAKAVTSGGGGGEPDSYIKSFNDKRTSSRKDEVVDLSKYK